MDLMQKPDFFPSFAYTQHGSNPVFCCAPSILSTDMYGQAVFLLEGFWKVGIELRLQKWDMLVNFTYLQQNWTTPTLTKQASAHFYTCVSSLDHIRLRPSKSAR